MQTSNIETEATDLLDKKDYEPMPELVGLMELQNEPLMDNPKKLILFAQLIHKITEEKTFNLTEYIKSCFHNEMISEADIKCMSIGISTSYNNYNEKLYDQNVFIIQIKKILTKYEKSFRNVGINNIINHVIALESTPQIKRPEIKRPEIKKLELPKQEIISIIDNETLLRFADFVYKNIGDLAISNYRQSTEYYKDSLERTIELYFWNKGIEVETIKIRSTLLLIRNLYDKYHTREISKDELLLKIIRTIRQSILKYIDVNQLINSIMSKNIKSTFPVHDSEYALFTNIIYNHMTYRKDNAQKYFIQQCYNDYGMNVIYNDEIQKITTDLCKFYILYIENKYNIDDLIKQTKTLLLEHKLSFEGNVIIRNIQASEIKLTKESQQLNDNQILLLFCATAYTQSTSYDPTKSNDNIRKHFESYGIFIKDQIIRESLSVMIWTNYNNYRTLGQYTKQDLINYTRKLLTLYLINSPIQVETESPLWNFVKELHEINLKIRRYVEVDSYELLNIFKKYNIMESCQQEGINYMETRMKIACKMSILYVRFHKIALTGDFSAINQIIEDILKAQLLSQNNHITGSRILGESKSSTSSSSSLTCDNDSHAYINHDEHNMICSDCGRIEKIFIPPNYKKNQVVHNLVDAPQLPSYDTKKEPLKLQKLTSELHICTMKPAIKEISDTPLDCFQCTECNHITINSKQTHYLIHKTYLLCHKKHKFMSNDDKNIYYCLHCGLCKMKTSIEGYMVEHYIPYLQKDGSLCKIGEHTFESVQSKSSYNTVIYCVRCVAIFQITNKGDLIDCIDAENISCSIINHTFYNDTVSNSKKCIVCKLTFNFLLDN